MKFAFYSFFLTLPLLAGCSQAEDKNQVAVAVRSINYNADRGVTFSLYDVSGQPDPKYKADPHIELRLDGYYPVGGGNLMALDGGGNECCANLPKQWRPGLKYTVLWQAGSADLPDKTVYRHTAELPRYEQPEDLTVVFYPQHKAEFVVGSSYPGEAGWKGRERKEPLEACMSKNDKRFCYMYLPHYDNVDDQFAEWHRIECRAVIQKNYEPKYVEVTKEGCIQWQKECLAGDGWHVSDKKMCRIDWRSPEWGE
ncbi:DUF3304 domain-containing protein [Neisseria dumasiana]|uniref:DUF3304 domain-containing protein n=1 Tax=Neisseria dumasiana TaxID=1931275 RepID=UPI000A19228F|nr:DUF3304 domain-containing protein [Neisseria dumasiana]OSI15032.1 hypothetical protein BV914_08260 [Neisseria dumasiana]